jgi:uncharacterized phage protein gp47/JayE
MPTFPLATLSAQVTPAGITAPSFNDILQSLIATMQSIFGSDIVVTPDSQDGQMLAAFAMAINDANQTMIAVYNAYSPTFAQGAGLSSLVKINGLQRQSPTNSTVQLTIAGVVGTTINNGVVQDGNGNLWNLPAVVIIPLSGAITVEGTCEVAGAINAEIGSITTIITVVQGWQSVTNPTVSVPGAPVESDAALRLRQSQSTAISGVTPLQSILAAVANIPGIERYAIYENDTAVPDANGIPGHSIAVVVQGGDPTQIAQTIEETKSPGTGTYGTTSITVEDPVGLPIPIKFFALALVQVYVSLTIQPLTGFVAQTALDIADAIAAFIDDLPIGAPVFFTSIFGPATLYGNPEGATYHVTVLTIGIAPAPVGVADIAVPFNEAAASSAAQVVVTVL